MFLRRRVAILKYFCLAFCLSIFLPLQASALDVPARAQGYVHDEANILPPAAQAQIESFLQQFEQTTSNQIVLATFPSLEGEALEDFSIRLAEAWKVGQKGKDNGVILLIFQKERKIRIEVGYGLEGALTDAESSLIISEVLTPHFQKGEFAQGIASGLVAIAKATEGEFTLDPSKRSRQRYGSGRRRQLTPAEMEALKKQGAVLGVMALIACFILFILDIFRYGKYRHHHQAYNKRYSFWEWFFRFAVLLAVLSFLFRMLFYMMLFSRGGYGGGRGGGFSGGGGSFGGGGASGGW